MANLYRLLGGFDLQSDPSSTSVLGPGRCRRLLARILLRPRVRFDRRVLAEQLFSDDPAKARQMLTDQLYLIRRADPQLELEVGPDTLRWSGRGAYTDVGLFLEASPSAELGSTVLDRALEWYRGDLLPEVDDPLVDEERGFLRKRSLELRERLVNNLSSLGQPSRALEIAEKWLLAAPGDDRALESVLKLCHSLGLRCRGQEHYRMAETYLRQELGTRPAATVRRWLLDSTPDKPASSPPRRSASPTASVIHSLDECLAFERVVQAGAFLAEARRLLGEGPGLWVRDLQWMDAQGDFSSLGKRANELLSRSVELNLPPPVQPLFESICLVALARAESESENLSQALKSLDRANRLLSHLGHDAASDEALGSWWTSPWMHAGTVRAASGVLRMNLHLLAGNSELAVEAGRQTICLLSDSLAPPGASKGADWRLAWILRARRVLGAILAQTGRPRDALSQLDLAKEGALSHGATELAEAIDVIRAGALDGLGRLEEARVILYQLVERQRQKGEPFTLAKTLYNLAAGMGCSPGTGDDTSLALCREAIELFAGVESEGWEASCHTTLGFLLWLRGRPDEALAAYQRARELHTKLGEALFLPEIQAYCALAHLDLGHNDQALELSRDAIEESLRGGETAVTGDLWLIRSLCLRQAQQPAEAQQHLVRAAEHVFAEAAQQETRRDALSYLDRDPIQRRLMAELTREGLAESYLSRLPLTPEAEATPSGGKLRRLRVLEELQSRRLRQQPATIERLARAVGASVRSVERDLAALRREGKLTR